MNIPHLPNQQLTTVPDTSRSTRRTGRRVALAVTAAVAVVTLPAGAASAADFGFWMYDVNQDGYVDVSAVDAVGPDGILDANLLDVSRNGWGDTWLLDTDQNGVADHIGFDRGEDGRFEEWHVDADENNAIEAVFVDQDGDGLPETMALSGPSNPTTTINWERDVCPTDPFWCMQWPQVSNNGGFAIPVDGVSIGAGLTSLGNAGSQLGGY